MSALLRVMTSVLLVLGTAAMSHDMKTAAGLPWQVPAGPRDERWFESAQDAWDGYRQFGGNKVNTDFDEGNGRWASFSRDGRFGASSQEGPHTRPAAGTV